MIIHLHTLSYPPKRFIGSELYDHQLMLALKKAGHKISVFASDFKHTGKPWKYEGITINPNPTKIAKTSFDQQKTFVEQYEKPDLIIVHVDCRQKAVLWWRENFKDQARPPMIGIVHNESPKTLGEASFYIWDAIIWNSSWISKEVEVPNTKNNWVLIPPVPVPVKQAKEKEKFIFQVNFGRTKGGTGVFKNLAEDLPKENFLAGTGGWGSQDHKDFEGLKNVQVLEHQPLNADFWKHVAVLLLPSNLESWSMIASEAIAHGSPVITYDNLPGVRENLGDAGIYLSPKASREEWKQAVAKAKKMSKVKILTQAQKNREIYEQELKKIVELIGETFDK